MTCTICWMISSAIRKTSDGLKAIHEIFIQEDLSEKSVGPPVSRDWAFSIIDAQPISMKLLKGLGCAQKEKRSFSHQGPLMPCLLSMNLFCTLASCVFLLYRKRAGKHSEPCLSVFVRGFLRAQSSYIYRIMSNRH